MREISKARQESSAQSSIKVREVIGYGMEASEVPV
jgi:hypothetical protein